MDFFNKMFSGEKGKKKEPFNKKIQNDFIVRKKYLEWLEKDELPKFLNQLKLQYGLYRTDGQEHEPWVDFLEIPGANGIMIHSLKYPSSLDNWYFVWEYLKDRVLSWGYKLYSSNERFTGSTKGVSFYRHYLKPPVRNLLDPPVDQIFGNVTIELQARDQEIQNLKIQIQHYQDHNYQSPRKIEDLYYSIFNED